MQEEWKGPDGGGTEARVEVKDAARADAGDRCYLNYPKKRES